MFLDVQKDDLINLRIIADTVKNFFASDEYYEEASELYLARQLENKGDNLHYLLYIDDADQSKIIVFSARCNLYPNPFTGQDGMWRISDLSYSPNGNWGDMDNKGVSQEALRLGMRLIRQYLDGYSIRYFYSMFNEDTHKIDTLQPDSAQQKRIFLNFLLEIQAISWEIAGTIQFDETHYIVHCDRNPVNKPQDEESWVKEE